MGKYSEKVACPSIKSTCPGQPDCAILEEGHIGICGVWCCFCDAVNKISICSVAVISTLTGGRW